MTEDVKHPSPHNHHQHDDYHFHRHQQKQDSNRNVVMIAMDGSRHSFYAFD
ncbi:unnamed protein product, partial [Candidula unifasciata]